MITVPKSVTEDDPGWSQMDTAGESTSNLGSASAVLPSRYPTSAGQLAYDQDNLSLHVAQEAVQQQEPTVYDHSKQGRDSAMEVRGHNRFPRFVLQLSLYIYFKAEPPTTVFFTIKKLHCCRFGFCRPLAFSQSMEQDI